MNVVVCRDCFVRLSIGGEASPEVESACQNLEDEFDIISPDPAAFQGFSWKPCECCLSDLGGDRFLMNCVTLRRG